MTADRTGVAARVPYLATPPPEGTERPALVVIVHMMDPPRSEAAMASALPLAAVPAWRAYAGLPMFGARAPEGGPDEIMRLGNEDALMNLLAPVIEQAAAELPAAVNALRTELGVGEASLALVGGSAGAAAVLLALAETDVPAKAVAVVNPAARVASVIEAGERVFGVAYEWTDESRAKAERLDFVSRAGEIAGRKPQPSMLIVQGDDDDETFVVAAGELHDALAKEYEKPEDVELVRVPGLSHPLADEPGMEAAPQTPAAAQVDSTVTRWLSRRLT
ncbi:MAG TPA: prolyl oligopeptidase family serine peptidase [Actinomycetota bacterium]|nr:prolyl oligopeptidase family serine peptidase [Actinomycetota bacterium]